ncbi:MAG: sterol desaturase family protein [Oceanospirillales bacterium]|nr:sterol desaturase family protein [Oceanospirillales bacterium]
MTYEVILRLGVFVVILGGCALLEWLRPRRRWRCAKRPRWVANLSLTLLSTVLARLTLGAFAVTAAVWAGEHGVGVFNWLDVPGWMASGLALVLLDGAIWLQHWLSHRVPLLWRLHRVHHTDPELDVTTALRFHPLEIGLSLLYKASFVVLLGVPVAAVVLFELLLNASALFTHANICIPRSLDRRLRWLFCTPDMHRIHHSVIPEETNSNYGFCLSIWDRLFATYRQQPQVGVESMQLGLREFTDPDQLGVLPLLVQPLKQVEHRCRHVAD